MMSSKGLKIGMFNFLNGIVYVFKVKCPHARGDNDYNLKRKALC